MGRPFLLGSLPRGPEHREFNELPALGTAPEKQKTEKQTEKLFLGPRRDVPTLSPLVVSGT